MKGGWGDLSRSEIKPTGSRQKACRHIGSKKVLVKAAPGASTEYLGHSGAGGAAAGLEEPLGAFWGCRCT